MIPKTSVKPTATKMYRAALVRLFTSVWMTRLTASSSRRW